VPVTAFDPAVHHRRSIRLKRHDYAGGGEYFITICAHREFIDAAGGRPFIGAPGNAGARSISPAREIIEKEWRRCGEIRKGVYPGEFVVMPDHVHGLIRIEPGASALGNVIGAFKAAVSRRVRATCVSPGNGDNRATCVSPGNGDNRATCVSPVRAPVRRGEKHLAPESCAPHAPMRIWHRNYYERIVRGPEERERIAHYIRMNPVRLVFALDGMRAMGNPAIWSMQKIGVLCSRGHLPPPDPPAWPGHACISGWHSPGEKAVLARLLGEKAHIIAVPPVAVESFHVPADWIEAFNAGRILLVAPFRDDQFSRAGALERNAFVAEQADRLWLSAVRPGGAIDRISKQYARKIIEPSEALHA
jgi:putative transposase